MFAEPSHDSTDSAWNSNDTVVDPVRHAMALAASTAEIASAVDSAFAAIARATPIPVAPPTPGARPPRPISTFGAGMLAARGVLAKPPPVRDATPDASAGPGTFGAGVLRARTSRAKLVVVLSLAVAAIAVVCFA